MRVIFFAEVVDDEKHLFTIEDMEVPLVGDIVWINVPGPRSESHLPLEYRGHPACDVIRRSFSITGHDTGMPGTTARSGYLYTSAHAEILLRVKKDE